MSSHALLAQMMGLHPVAIDMGLERVFRLLHALDDPHLSVPPVIHIAGTNGKGSTQAMLRAGLMAAGQRVHAYTSPHLVRFHERITLSGAQISEPDLVAVLSETLERNAGEGITFFEASTLAAFLAFARVPADVLLLEVGLGGRLDVTNVIDAPLLTVITPVDLDHQEFLGTTLAAIAAEKAGILKRNVPCVVGPQHDEALRVIEDKAARLSVPLLAHGQHWHVSAERGRLVFQDETGLLDLPLPKLPGAHQIQNAGIALAALRHLGHNEAVCEAAVLNADWPARLQRLTAPCLQTIVPKAEIWLDGGHNPAAGAVLAAHLAQQTHRANWAIAGMMGTKDATGFLAPLVPHLAGLICVPVPDTPQAQDPAMLAATARALGLSPELAADIPSALRLIAARDPAARVLICGSLYLAGSVLRWIEDHAAA